MERYKLSIWFEKEENFHCQSVFADLIIPLKNKKLVNEWIDNTVKKAILQDNVNGKNTKIK